MTAPPQGRVMSPLMTLQGSSQKGVSNFPLGPRGTGCREGHHMRVWASRSILGSQLSSKCPELCRRDSVPGQVEDDPSNREACERRMGSAPGQAECSGLTSGAWY